MIKIMLNGVEKTYNSLAHAIKENGATSGMNKENALKFLAKLGFDVSTLTTEDGVKVSTESTPRAPKKTLIELLIEAVKVVDPKAVASKQAEVLQAVKTMKTEADVLATGALMNELEALSNPVVTIEALHAHVTKLFDEYQAKQAAREATDAQASAEAK